MAFKQCLLAFHDMATCSTTVAPLALPIEACVTHLLFNVPKPVPGGPAVRFSLGNGSAPLQVSCAASDFPPFIDYSMALLLRRLSVHTLVTVFTALLLEQQLVVVSDDDELRVATCELLLALIHPLEWAQVLSPPLPSPRLHPTLPPVPSLWV